MFAPAGLGAIDEGYNQGAESYWRRKSLENANAADQALGNLFMSMQGGGGGMPQMAPPGPSPMPMAPPTPPMMPPGGAGGAGGPQMMPPGGPGAATYPRIPYTGQPGPPMQLGPPGMPSGPPGVPLAGGPPPGFVNPSRVAGQPQNLTGPIIPPGGMGPMGPSQVAGPPGPGGAPPMAGAPQPAGPQPQPPMGMPGTPASMPRMGSMGWEDLAQRIVRANPGAPPEIIAQAMNKAAPFMTAQAQQDWRYIELELQRERQRTYEESVRQRPGIAAMRPEVQLLDKWWETHPEGTPEQAAEFLRSTKGGGASRETPAQTMLKRFIDEHKDDNEGRGPTAQQLQDFTNQPKFLQQDKAITSREGMAAAGRTSREGMAAAGREATGERAAAGRESREGMAAAGRTSREGIAGAGREATGARQDKALGAAAERQQTGITAKQAPAQQAAKSVTTQIDSIINDITDSQKGGAAVTGFQGRFNRWNEWLQGTLDNSDETRATVFESKVRALQAQIPRMLAGVGRISAEERANIDNIVRGLGAFTDPKAAIDSLKYLKEVIASKTVGAPPAAGAKGRTSQQPVPVPPATELSETEETGVRAPDGTVHWWVLRNGEPVEVRGGQGASPFDQPPAAAPPEKHTKNINPTMKAGRDAVVDYIMRASERTATTLMDIVKDPMSMVGGTELGTIPKSVAQGFLKSLVEGKTINQVSRETGYAVTSIRQIADRAGVKSSGKQFGAESSWTPEQDALVRDRRKEGKTYAAIAKELGKSRNAVIGRVNRERSE